MESKLAQIEINFWVKFKFNFFLKIRSSKIKKQREKFTSKGQILEIFENLNLIIKLKSI